MDLQSTAHRLPKQLDYVLDHRQNRWPIRNQPSADLPVADLSYFAIGGMRVRVPMNLGNQRIEHV